MQIEFFELNQTDEVVAFFTKVFTSSEGHDEGVVIGTFVLDLIQSTAPNDLIGLIGQDKKDMVASVFFSKLILPSGKTAFILSPMAVSTDKQRKGYGQEIIKKGLNYLKSKGVELVFSYGDPNFYSKVGFEVISEYHFQPPQPLSYPQGWIALSLNGSPLEAEVGQLHCVAALNHKRYW